MGVNLIMCVLGGLKNNVLCFLAEKLRDLVGDYIDSSRSF